MKKKNLNQKLQLNKETIANLNNNEMNNVKGGTITQVETCGWKTECRTCNPTCNDTCQSACITDCYQTACMTDCTSVPQCC